MEERLTISWQCVCREELCAKGVTSAGQSGVRGNPFPVEGHLSRELKEVTVSYGDITGEVQTEGRAGAKALGQKLCGQEIAGVNRGGEKGAGSCPVGPRGRGRDFGPGSEWEGSSAGGSEQRSGTFLLSVSRWCSMEKSLSGHR